MRRWSDPVAIRLAADLLGRRCRHDAPLGAATTYRVGGPAALGFTAESVADLEHVRRASAASGLATVIVGRGSNLLVSDDGFEGIAVSLGEGFATIRIDDDACSVTAGGALPLPVLARRCAAAGLGGLEWAVGVPGSVGGGVAMNAGGHGSDIAAALQHAEIFCLTQPFASSPSAGHAAPGTLGELPWALTVGEPPMVLADSSELAFGYRTSAIGAGHVVTAARFACVPSTAQRCFGAIAEIVAWRRAHQPGGQNAGSVFANPPQAAAGCLIDRAGLRGTRLGTARVSERHANFIVAQPGGAAADVRRLMQLVAARVYEAVGVQLQPEVRLVGFVDGRGDGLCDGPV